MRVTVLVVTFAATARFRDERAVSNGLGDWSKPLRVVLHRREEDLTVE